MLRELAMIGGLIRGTQSGTVWALTVEHVGYEMWTGGKAPTRMEATELINMQSPSTFRIDTMIKFHKEWIRGSNFSPAREITLQRVSNIGTTNYTMGIAKIAYGKRSQRKKEGRCPRGSRILRLSKSIRAESEPTDFCLEMTSSIHW